MSLQYVVCLVVQPLASTWVPSIPCNSCESLLLLTYLHSRSSEAISQFGWQLAAGLVDLGAAVLQLVGFVKDGNMPRDPEHVLQVAPAAQHTGVKID